MALCAITIKFIVLESGLGLLTDVSIKRRVSRDLKLPDLTTGDGRDDVITRHLLRVYGEALKGGIRSIDLI